MLLFVVLYVWLVWFIVSVCMFFFFFFFKQKTAYEMRISDWSSDVCSSDLASLECTDVAGFQSLAEFTDRRLLPAVRTCASFVRRLETLSVRIERATSLLRTRVDLAMQAQNVELLRSMEIGRAHV